MRGDFNILEYWIKQLRKVKEFREIAKVENHEFERLYGATDLALDNLFIETADETAIKRFEKIVGIYPDATDTLEYRRSRLYSYWIEKQPYTDEELYNRLYTLCDGNFEIDPDYPNYIIHIITEVGTYGLFDEITHVLDYFLPANLDLDLQNQIHGGAETGFYVGVSTETAISYMITNDINAVYPVEGNVGVATVSVNALNPQITNDISVKQDINEATNIGSVVSSSMIITM